ncbi:hypothetical protein A2Z53_00795 [Candidatus Giovannonibacteria bacterium RIFCSPHIGHO2_02_42_15]|uniref:Uncharacterized protein n=2 Tax=Candidatus Giovannoniibacteriota TaxID=1752738 RepID=A0A1F5VLQ4_9BACT|nr:MAG: hypothetical protein UV11_C0020G0008 [Candidatus Giovannonibacteria bacterium GW2011_GWF2_42_19]OGF64320.1 MAG: hypothetical protein A2Z53_00795 [Candidatus Giovannonibacteria bacterium RIFCSPHIGHO2_02_42_15]
MANISITLPKVEKKRLEHLALSYGLSLPELSQRVLESLASEIPEESIEEYKNSKKLLASYKRALRDWKAGRVRSRL